MSSGPPFAQSVLGFGVAAMVPVGSVEPRNRWMPLNDKGATTDSAQSTCWSIVPVRLVAPCPKTGVTETCEHPSRGGAVGVTGCTRSPQIAASGSVMTRQLVAFFCASPVRGALGMLPAEQRSRFQLQPENEPFWS